MDIHSKRIVKFFIRLKKKEKKIALVNQYFQINILLIIAFKKFQKENK